MDLKTMIKYILYTIPFFFLIGCTNVIINNESINRINLILNYQIILIITIGLLALFHLIIKDVNK